MEKYKDIREAIQREKQLKNWPRDWKLNLIKSINPEMSDLAKEWFNEMEIQEYRRTKNEEMQLERKRKLNNKSESVNNVRMPKQVRHDS